MPPTTRSNRSSIISPSPHLPQTRSFTMTNYTTIINVSFVFSGHPACLAFSSALNNTYAEPLATAAVVSLFTDAGRTSIVTDVVPVLLATIIDAIMITSTADRTVVAPIINGMFLFVRGGNPLRKLPIRTTSTIKNALDAHVGSNQQYFLSSSIRPLFLLTLTTLP